MAIRYLSGQTIDGTLTVSGNIQAPTFNGLAINTTGTNNVANQIVRTQANGYANFGWINSVSGNHTGSITRITASDDAYLRYVTPAQFRTGVTDGYYAPASTVSGVTSVATGNGLTGGTIISTGTLSMSGSYTGNFTVIGTIKIGSGSLTNPSTNANDIVIDNGAGVETGMTFASSVASSIRFGQFVNNSIGSIEYIHTGNHLRFITNGNERVRIVGVGNVIIGDISGTSPNGADRFLKIGKSNLQDCSIILQDAVETWEIYQNDNLSFSYGTTPTTVLTLARTTGNVGIGTASPGTFLQLGSYPVSGTYVNIATYPDIPSEHMMHLTAPSTTGYYGGGISFGENAFTAANITAIDAGGGGALHLAFGTGSASGMTERLRIANDGNVGIGTVDPDHKLEVVGGLALRNSNSRLYFGTNNGPDRRALEGNVGGTLLQVGEGYSNTALYGNVGIGTTSPTEKLQIVQGQQAMIGDYFMLGSGNANYMGVLGFNRNTTNGVIYNSSYGAFQIHNNNGALCLQGYNGSGTNQFEHLFFNNGSVFFDGNLGIGTTTPNKRLTVYGGNDNGIWIDSQGGQYTSLAFGHNGTEKANIAWDNTNGYTNISTYAGGHLAMSTGGGIKAFLNSSGNFGIGTTTPSSELEVNGRVIVEKLEVARYSDVNAPAAVYVGRLANPMGAGGVFRLGAIQSSSTVNKIDEPFLITYSSGHWGCQPMFFAEFTVTYYRGSYIKYWAQHEVSGSRLEIVDGPYGGQIISGGAPVSRTITTLCTNCHAGQPVYKCVWKWSNSGTYIKTSPIVSIVDGHGSGRVYTSGSSSESAIDTLLGSAGSPGPAYLLMGIDNAQAAGFTGLQTQN